VNIEEAKQAEVKKLDDLETTLNSEYEGGDLTSAQRVSVLSEIRKVIWLRSVLNGLVVVPERES
jgi:hypothetical protein